MVNEHTLFISPLLFYLIIIFVVDNIQKHLRKDKADPNHIYTVMGVCMEQVSKA